jgi:hypothetical protein
MRTAKTGAAAEQTNPARWLLLVHQLPAKPAYLRVKIWRRLRDIGAIALKNSIYVLPQTPQTSQNFRRVLEQIGQSKGEGVLCESEFVAGLSDRDVQNLFNKARDADYQALAKVLSKRVGKRTKNRDTEIRLELEKARQQLAQIEKIDFFGAGGRQTVESLMSRLEHVPIVKADKAKDETAPVGLASYAAQVWVTRKGVHIDRIACAWLIRRFIDPKAKFKFVSGKTYRHASGELRFDMANAEFTHEGDACSFEVFLARMNSKDGALAAIAEIVHNLDLKDQKFDRPESSGIGHIVEGICATQGDDLDRIARGSVVFDDAYERFRSNIAAAKAARRK